MINKMIFGIYQDSEGIFRCCLDRLTCGWPQWDQLLLIWFLSAAPDYSSSLIRPQKYLLFWLSLLLTVKISDLLLLSSSCPSVLFPFRLCCIFSDLRRFAVKKECPEPRPPPPAERSLLRVQQKQVFVSLKHQTDERRSALQDLW